VIVAQIVVGIVKRKTKVMADINRGMKFFDALVSRNAPNGSK
jgi:hypothetical protein